MNIQDWINLLDYRELKIPLLSPNEAKKAKHDKVVVLFTDGDTLKAEGAIKAKMELIEAEDCRWYIGKEGYNRLERGLEIETYHRGRHIVEVNTFEEHGSFELMDNGYCVCQGVIFYAPKT